MEYFRTARWFLRKNSRKYITFILGYVSAITLNFLFISMMFLNKNMFNVKDIAVFGVIIASTTNTIIVLSYITIYSFNSYIRARDNELKTLMILGLTRKELKILLAIEQMYLSVFCLIMGTLLGTIFSKLFYIVIFKYVGVQRIDFIVTISTLNHIIRIASLNYIVNTGFAMLLYFIILINIIRVVENLDINVKLKTKKNTRINKKNIILVLVLVLEVYSIINQYKNNIYEQMYINTTCTVILYIYVFYFNKLLLSNKINLFNKKLSVVKEIVKNIEINKGFMFFISYFGYFIIYYKYTIEMNIPDIKELMIVDFILNFNHVLFFYISSKVILFKFKAELKEAKNFYSSLFALGLTKNELKKIANIKLKAEFAAPAILYILVCLILVFIVKSNISIKSNIFMIISFSVAINPFILYLYSYMKGKAYLKTI